MPIKIALKHQIKSPNLKKKCTFGEKDLQKLAYLNKKQYLCAKFQRTLRSRMSIFQAQTKSNKTLVTTFVTTFGVADGLHRSIVNSEVTMDDLFTG